MINEANSSQVSTNVTANLSHVMPYDDIPVEYPDYSEVDVGEGIVWPQRVFAPYVDGTAWPPYQIADVSETETDVLFIIWALLSQDFQLYVSRHGVDIMHQINIF